MNDLNTEYYFAFRPDDDSVPILQADENARFRRYRYSKLSFGAPLMFGNGFRDEFIKRGITEKLGGVLNDSPFYLVETRIRDEIERFSTPGLQLYPAIYVDNAGQYHEDYWFTNFHESVDVMDWDASVYDVIDGESPEDDEYLFDKILLDSRKLSAIPEKQRLLLHVENLGYVIFHQRIVDFVTGHGISGVNFFRVSEFVDGDQYS